ncbi:4'-phosphopantetheinyl transferase family protein [Tychonema bourrellyi]|nr:4'-phosphopantetheinyl transferase superfamily protein [Tychonema bourrellyi]
MMNTNIIEWKIPPKDLILNSDEVHVWRVDLEMRASCLQSLQESLSTDELKRAERFYFQKDRAHFIAARGILRKILGCYLNKNPNELRFSYNPYGKPSLVTAVSEYKLCFNLSHSHGIALIAVEQNREVGIDIERIRKDFPYQQIAESFFSPFENAVLRSLPEHQQLRAFFTCWTRKEAYIKAVGKGLSIPLNGFDVAIAPGEPAALLNFLENPKEVSRWSLIELIPGLDMVATLAVEGDRFKILCWQWQYSC